VPLSLRSFLDSVPEAILRLGEPIATRHAITALQHVLGEDGRHPILVVERPVLADGTTGAMPVVTNLGASRELLARALGWPSHREAAQRYAAAAGGGIDPLVVGGEGAPVQAMILKGEAADLTRLPALTQHSLDPGPYLTAAYATTVDPETGIDNTAIQRCWIKQPRRMSWFPYPASHNRQNLRKYWAKGEPCPVAFWIGHHPAILMGAQAKLGYPESHWRAAGGLAREPVRLVPSLSFGARLRVPADAEIVIEGVAPPDLLEADGPFGEYTSYSGPQVVAPVCEVLCITHRRDALYHDYGSGLADALVADNLVNEGKLFAAIRRAAPSLANVHVPFSGRRFHAYLQLADPRPGEARAALAAALEDRRVKLAIALDADIDLFDEARVLWAVATRVQWHRDTWVAAGLPGSSLDPSWSAGATTTSKIAIDATLPPTGGGAGPRPVPPVSRVPAAALERARLMLAATERSAWPRQ
jgi:UbiD family decarboxylase